MTAPLWIALVLVVLWFVVKFMFKVVGWIVHLLLIFAVVAVAFYLLR